MKKRILSLALCVLMTLSLLPMRARAASETLFDRYIPVNQVYAASVSPYSLARDDDASFQYSYTVKLGTRFDYEGMNFLSQPLKRPDLQGYFFKLTYKGTFGALDKSDMMYAFNLKENDYLLAMEDPSAQSYAYYKTRLTPDTVVFSIDLCDSGRKVYKTLCSYAAILAVGPEGEFVACNLVGGKTTAFYFSTLDNIFKSTDDIDPYSSSRVTGFKPVDVWVTDKNEAEGLIGSTAGGSSEPAYEFIQYPALTGAKQYMTNVILSENEFISPDNTYYQVGHNTGEIDPVVKNKIENVVDYSQYGQVLEAGTTRRSVLTADGTLYGVSTDFKKEVLATGVKQAGKAHYLTNKGEVKEITTGKTIATNCKSFAEHRYATVIGILKNDGSAWLGYTYLAAESAYAKGLSKVMDKAKAVVAGGVCSEDNKFYRWKEEVIPMGYDEAAWSRGEFIQYNDYQLSLDLLTDNAVRVFPEEYFSAEQSTAEEAMTGFVINGSGEMWAFGLQNTFEMGEIGLIQHIFPIYKSKRPTWVDNGNFVGLLPETKRLPYAMVANHCSNNRPVIGELGVDYLSDVPGGYKALDGYTYAFDNDADDGTSERKFKMVPTTFHYLNDGSEIFKALNTTTNPISSLYLLPNVARSSYDTDNVHGSTVLLERTDGSMWMTQIYPKASGSVTVAKLGGWECSNAIQITQPTTELADNTDYVDLVSREVLNDLFDLGDNIYPEDPLAAPYMESDYYVQVRAGEADQLYRQGDPFLLLVTRSECPYSKTMQQPIKEAIEQDQVPIYGCVDDTSAIQFIWDYTAANSVATPYFALVTGTGKVQLFTGVRDKTSLYQVLEQAKAANVSNSKATASDPFADAAYPSGLISVSRQEWDVLRYTNRERFKEGLTMLAMPAVLQNACNTRENELVTLFSHTRPNGQGPQTAIESSFLNSRTWWAENIAGGQRNAAQVVNEWMNSPGHRANILTAGVHYMGVGFINSSPTYWVQLFANTAGFTSATTSTGSMTFKSEEEMQKAYLICKDKDGITSYLPIDVNYMTKDGNTYTMKLQGLTVTLKVGSDIHFTDVDSRAAWAKNAIYASAEAGLVLGAGGKFDPTAELSWAQAITFAVRLAQYQAGEHVYGKEDQGSPWYQVYVDYALAHGFIDEAPAKPNDVIDRSDALNIFAAVLDENAPAVNDVPDGYFTDLTPDHPVYEAAYKLARAGITNGIGGGKFGPDAELTREQVSALVARIAGLVAPAKIN